MLTMLDRTFSTSSRFDELLQLRSGNISFFFGCYRVVRLFKLFSGNIRILRIIGLCKLYYGLLLGIGGECLHELRSWDLPGQHGIIELRNVSCGNLFRLLRFDQFYSMFTLFRGQVFGRWRERLQQL